MQNLDIRDQAKVHGVRLWRIADALGIEDSYFSKKLRKELPVAEKTKVFKIIDQLSEESK